MRAAPPAHVRGLRWIALGLTANTAAQIVCLDADWSAIALRPSEPVAAALKKYTGLNRRFLAALGPELAFYLAAAGMITYSLLVTFLAKETLPARDLREVRKSAVWAPLLAAETQRQP